MLFNKYLRKKSNKREIIMVFSYYGIGGAQRRAINLANSFIERGYNVSIVSLYGEDGTIENKNFYELDSRVELIMLPDFLKNHEILLVERMLLFKNKRSIQILKVIQRAFRKNRKINRLVNWKIRKIRKSEGLNAYLLRHLNASVICFGFNIFDRVCVAAKRTRCKLIYAETNASRKYMHEDFFDERFRQVKEATAWVFQTHEQLAFHNIEKKNKVVIYNPISGDLPMPYEGERRKEIVNFCRISPQKNLMLLVKAFKLIKEVHPEYKLYIYGDAKGEEEEAYKQRLKQYIGENRLENDIFLMKATSQIHDRVLRSSIFVSSSDYEGISNSMIEAMAIGLPCICTDCVGGGAREFIANEENGILVPMNDEKALAKALSRFICDEALMRHCSRNAIKVRELLDSQKIANEWISFIEQVA